MPMWEMAVKCSFCCCTPGEKAHQRLLPQPHVPSSAPHQPGGPSSLLPPHPILPPSYIHPHRPRWRRVGLLLTPSTNLQILTSKPNTRQSKQINEAKFYCAFILYYSLSEPFLSSFVVFFYMFILSIQRVHSWVSDATVKRLDRKAALITYMKNNNNGLSKWLNNNQALPIKVTTSLRKSPLRNRAIGT